MERITGPGATPDKLFTEGDPSLGIDATTVTANWLNGVQEELIHILEEAGITPDGAALTQVLEALRTLFWAKNPLDELETSHGVAIAAKLLGGPFGGGFTPGQRWTMAGVFAQDASEDAAYDNRILFAGNAILDGGVWKNRAPGNSVAVQLQPANNSISFLKSVSPAQTPGSTVVWSVIAELTSEGLTTPSLAPLETSEASPYSADVQLAVPLIAELLPIAAISLSGKLYITNALGVSNVVSWDGNPFKIGSNQPLDLWARLEDTTPWPMIISYSPSVNKTILSAIQSFQTGTVTLRLNTIVPARAFI